MNDEDLRSIPYAQLWWSEMGAHVAEYRPAAVAVAEPQRTPAPDDPDRPGQFTRGEDA